MPIEKVRYHKRYWLNPPCGSTGSCVFFEGKTSYSENAFFVEIADCHGKVRLHKTDEDTVEDFVKKIRLLGNGCLDFAKFIENGQESNMARIDAQEIVSELEYVFSDGGSAKECIDYLKSLLSTK